MLSLSNLTVEKLRMTAKSIGVNGYKNISRQQLENILTKLSPSILTYTSIHTGYKPKTINGAIDGRYVKYKSEKN